MENRGITVELEQVDCPVCGPSQISIWLNDGKPTRYVRCHSCGTVFASPRLARSLRHANTDAAWSYSPNLLVVEENRRPALKKEAEFIQQYIQDGSILDVGCSSGDFFAFFPEPGWKRYGVELSSSTADHAAQTYNANVVSGTLRSAKWPSGLFDVVSMIDMFYYVDEPSKELDEIRRILKPEGILAIEITGQAYMFARSRGLIALLMDGRWCRLNTESHLYWYKPTGLESLLKRNGFHAFAWYVVPSPVQSSRIANFVSAAYYQIFSVSAGRSLRILNWAPKYLCLARPSDNFS
jgi:SAM-dependent methyltransferase